MIDKYIVVQLLSQDIQTVTFDTYEEAQEAVTESGEKCLIVKVENICDQGYPPTTVTIEPHL